MVLDVEQAEAGRWRAFLSAVCWPVAAVVAGSGAPGP
jgi:hypothetical protein